MCSSHGSLTALQVQVLAELASLEPRWTLTGGGALGVRYGHRTTRDVDLFWHGLASLDDLPRRVKERLERLTEGAIPRE